MASKRVYGKQATAEGVEVKFVVGDELEATLKLKKSGVQTKFGTTNVAYLKLNEPFKSKGKDAKAMKVGDDVFVWIKAGLAGLMDVPEGSEVKITCTGERDTGKGNPMATFDIVYNEPQAKTA